MHGLASWFDLDFEAHDLAKGREAPDEQDVLEQAAWDYPIAASTWPWMTAEPPLNPGPTPEPPRKGVKVTLSTGPDGECGRLTSLTLQPHVHTGSEYTL